MGEGDIHQILSEALWTVLVAPAPVLVAALGVGLGIALFQALTSVQDMTLTFVPKVAAIVVVLGFSLPFIYSSLTLLSDEVFSLIISDGY